MADTTGPFLVRVAIRAAQQADSAEAAYAALTDRAVLDALVALDDPGAFAAMVGEIEVAARGRKCVTQVRPALKAARQARVRRLRERGSNVSGLSLLPPGIDSQLRTGRYQLSDAGISAVEVDRDGNELETVVCYQPIVPVGYAENVETGARSALVAWYRGGWRTAMIDRAVLASRQKIPDLARLGMLVSSENAGRMVDYLTAIEAMNEGAIPVWQAAGHLGWVGTRFAPYDPALRYDGEDSYKALYDAVRASGDYDAWLACARAVRAEGGAARVFLAAAFAAPLLEPLGALSFFVHLWGRTGGGKTVALMLAASVWGDPAEGRLVRPMSGTAVGLELTAAFLHNLPMCLDELQSARDRQDFSQMIYMLSEGAGKPRGNRSGGIRQTGSWRTAILTTGEQALSDAFTSAGAVNRVIDLEMDGPLFARPKAVADAVRAHHGHAGRAFVERLMRMDAGELKRRFDAHVEAIAALGDHPDKQRANAAALLLADELAEAWIFHDGRALDAREIAGRLARSEDVDAFAQMYAFVCGWVAGNRFRFDEGREGVELWGKTVGTGRVAIISAVLAEALAERGYNFKTFLAGAEARGLLELDGQGKRTKLVKFEGRPVRCAVIALEEKVEAVAAREQTRLELGF